MSVPSGNSSIQISLHSGYGRRLKRILHTVFPTSEVTNRAYDHENMNGSKITSNQTSIDSKPLQDYRLSCLQPTAAGPGMEDWRENEQFCKRSAIPNSASYYLNWFHCDSFSNPKRGSVLLPDSNIAEGLILDQPISWSFSSSAPTALNHYTFATFMRTVLATSMGTAILVASPMVGPVVG